MKDLSKVKIGITHAGKFHSDDVLSAVLLKELNPLIEFERKDDYLADDSKEEEIAFDVGLGEFDHHEESRELDPFGQPYSAFGKLWRVYGRECLVKHGFKNIEKAFNKFNYDYVSKIDLGDNEGYKMVKPFFYENEMIVRFNPSWYEKKADQDPSNRQFLKAVEFAKMIFENWLRKVYEIVELGTLEKGIWEEALDKEKDGIVILQERIPWQYFVKKNNAETVKFIVSKSDRGGYNVSSVDSSLYRVKDSGHFRFVHPSGFLGVADSLEEAIQGAKCSLGMA